MAAQKIGRASTLSRRRIVGTTPGGKHIAEKNIAEKKRTIGTISFDGSI